MAEQGEIITHDAPLDEITGKPVCKQCGVSLEEDQTRCPECGAVVDEIDEVEESLIHWGDEIVYPEDVCDV